MAVHGSPSDLEIELLDRIAAHGAPSPEERKALRALGTSLDPQEGTGRVGRFSLELDRAGNVYIADRIYRGADADAILDALITTNGGRLRSVGGIIALFGVILCVAGIAIFGYTLFVWASEPKGFPDPSDPSSDMGFPTGFAVAGAVFMCGFVISLIGAVIARWQAEGEADRRRQNRERW